METQARILLCPGDRAKLEDWVAGRNTPQKPLTRATQRSDAAIAAQALIYWGDETGISNQDQIGPGSLRSITAE